MRPFKIETRLDREHHFGGEWMLQTLIQEQGKPELGSRVAISDFTMTGKMAFDYILERHFHEIKVFLRNQSADQLYKDSPEYQRMKAQVNKANAKLDDIADIADPDERP